MTTRRPLKLDGSNLKEMSDAELETVRSYLTWYLGNNIAAGTSGFTKLNVLTTNTGFGGAAQDLIDSRLRSGTAEVSTTAYAPETTTSEPEVHNILYDRLSQTDGDTSMTQPADTSNIRWPVYQDNGNIRAMNTTDCLDTFIEPAINSYKGSVNSPGQYRIHTSTSLTNYTNVSSNIVFQDTRANTGTGGFADAAATIGTQGTRQDFPTTITNYYLMRRNVGSAPSYTYPICITSDNNLSAAVGDTSVNTYMQQLMKWAHANHSGYIVKWRYSTMGSGTNLGSGMTDTRLTGGNGNYQQRFVNADDYRSQEFPDGTATTQNTYYLRCYLA
jgi:hypothetical protein